MLHVSSYESERVLLETAQRLNSRQNQKNPIRRANLDRHWKFRLSFSFACWANLQGLLSKYCMKIFHTVLLTTWILRRIANYWYYCFERHFMHPVQLFQSYGEQGKIHHQSKSKKAKNLFGIQASSTPARSQTN